MDLELRERRRREAAIESRRRAGVALVLALLAHLVGLPIGAAVLASRRPTRPPPPPKVELVEIPAAAWDAALGASGVDPRRRAQRVDERQQERRQPAERPPEPERKEPERPPGQVVEVAPGNGEEAPDARFAAESSNRVEKETIARNRSPGQKVTMPRQTVAERPPEGEPGPAGQGLGFGADGGDGGEPGAGESGTRIEIPSIARRDRVALAESPDGEGTIANREGSEALEGNSDWLRLQLGAGAAEGSGPGERLGGDGRTLRLFPSDAALDRIAGGPAPDHVEGVEEGEGTFLNTREWKYASFFNRVKRNVSLTWDPMREMRRRDPTGQIYAFKDRYTLLTVVLDDRGQLADVWVERSSGVDFLDREAIAAFERAQPFPNPPRGLVDERGEIRFQFGFYIESGRSGFRLFRTR